MIDSLAGLVQFKRRLKIMISRILLLATSVQLISCSKPLPQAQVQNQQLFPRSCAFSLKNKNRLSCYDYYTDVGQTGFRLPVVVIRNQQTSARHPVVYLPGGPGATHITHSDSVGYWVNWLQTTNLDRDLVLFDLRGAAPGDPDWDCKLFGEISKSQLRRASTVEEEALAVFPVLTDCVKKFDSRLRKALTIDQSRFPGAGLAQVSTRRFAYDVRQIMAALGYQGYALLASSYGTRLAMELAATAPEVEKLVLDSPYPAGRGGVTEVLDIWSSAFERLFETYQSDALRETFWQAMGQLRSSPERVRVRNWSTRAEISWYLTSARFSQVIYHAMYSSNLHRQIPRAVKDLIDGNLIALQPLLESFYNTAFDPYFNSMIFVATECNDNPDPSAVAFTSSLESAPQWQPFFKMDYELNICRSELFRNHKPLTAEPWQQPTLVASGALDPITSVEYARQARSLASEGVLIEVADMAHAEFIDDGCGRALIAQFLEPDLADRDGQWADNFHQCHAAESMSWQ